MGYAPEDTCPKCKNAKLVFGRGVTFECSDGHGAEPDELYCPDFGADFEIDSDWLRKRELAVEIADDLFTTKSGEKAAWLVLTMRCERDGSGWCHTAVVDRIIKILSSKQNPKP